MPSTSPLQQYVAIQRRQDLEMARILVDAADEARRIVARTAGKGGTSAALDRARAQQVNRELRKLSTQLWGKEITPQMKRGMTIAAKEAVNSETFFNDVIENALGKRLPDLEAAYRFDAEKSMANLYARSANGIPLSRAVYDTKALADGLVDTQIQRSLALQESAKQLADRVVHLINPRTPGGVSYAANRLARTEINNAFHRAQVDRRDAEPWTEGMRWHLSGSHPKPDKCNDYAESTHYTGGEAGVFKANNVPGKPHPQCLCYMTTVTQSPDDFLKAFFDGKYDGYLEDVLDSPAPGPALRSRTSSTGRRQNR